MDPLQTLRELLYSVIANDHERTEELAQALDEWLVRTGYAPASWGQHGFANYQTWAVQHWLTADVTADLACRKLARAAVASAPSCRQVASGDWRIEEAPRQLLVEALKEFVDDRSPLCDEASLYSDLLGSALYCVDWPAIAEAFLRRAAP